LFDRKKLIEKFAYNEYTPLKSYFPGGDAENPDNKLVEYDPQRALELLKEAGFTERDVDGTLMRKGERLSVTITYDEQGFEKYYTAYQEACRKVGVEIKLDLVDDAALWKKLQDRSFTFAASGFTGSLFPEPRPEWSSATADQEGSNNVTGFKNAKADEIINKYDQTFDAKKRNALLRELDGVIFNEHPYMLQWYVPCQRILWWHKFGMPKTVFSKYADWRDVYTTWWFDPELAQKLKKARNSGETLPVPDFELHPWGKEAAAETAKN
jgi:microcin C transport system substrate-binding protein